MKRKPKVKVTCIREMLGATATDRLIERLYMTKEKRSLGYRIYNVEFTMVNKHFHKLTTAVDEMDAMRQIIYVTYASYRKAFKLDRYGCPK